MKKTNNEKTKIKKTKTLKNSKKNKKEQKIEKTNHKTYIGFGARVITYVFLFLILLTFGLNFLLKSFSFIEQKTIDYNEKSKLDYRVYLKENDFYETPYLDKNMLYIASLIDKINIDFAYDFSSSENIDLDFDYDIIAKLIISDSKGENPYFEKEYTLLGNKKIKMLNNNKQAINESISIDYTYYNTLANNFKMTFGINTTSNLIVYLKINKISDSNTQITNNTNLMLIKIPLSEKSINIKLDYKEIDNSSTILSDADFTIENVAYIVLAIILIITSTIMLIKSIRLLLLMKSNKNIYDKYVNRLLIEYDRVIVETSTYPSFEAKEIIKIDKFEELLDVRDNLKLPITYYSITKHQKCYFYISTTDKVYLHIVKSVDLEDKNKKI